MNIAGETIILLVSVITLIISGSKEGKLTTQLDLEINNWKIAELTKKRFIAQTVFLLSSAGIIVGIFLLMFR